MLVVLQIEALPEIVRAVGGSVPVFVDGGIRNGRDVFKVRLTLSCFVLELELY